MYCKQVSGIKYKVDTTQPMSTKGKTPWMTFNGMDIADSQMCIEHLCEKLESADIDRNLSEEQKAISRATRIMFEVTLISQFMYKVDADL